jgi:hypothetical protein
MRLIVSGGREFADVPLIWRELDKLLASEPIEVLMEGASDDVAGPYRGADFWAHEWALAREIPALRVRAKWKEHGKAAGPIRNGEMIKLYQANFLLAFPGGAGTADMIRQAERAGLAIKRVHATARAAS